jgi:hypothetical protein
MSPESQSPLSPADLMQSDGVHKGVYAEPALEERLGEMRTTFENAGERLLVVRAGQTAA